MDQSAEKTQKFVILGAILLGLIVVFSIGYGLWSKAKVAEGELAQKEALEKKTARDKNDTNISLTGEAQSSNFNYEDLLSKDITPAIATETYVIVNENEEVIIPPEPTSTPPAPKPIVKKRRRYVNPDKPLTDEQIRRIRMLPVDQSAAGALQTILENESEGEYRARY